MFRYVKRLFALLALSITVFSLFKFLRRSKELSVSICQLKSTLELSEFLELASNNIGNTRFPGFKVLSESGTTLVLTHSATANLNFCSSVQNLSRDEAIQYFPSLECTSIPLERFPSHSFERTVALLKPDFMERMDKGQVSIDSVLNRINEARLRIVFQQRRQLNRNELTKFYAEHATRSFFPELLEYMSRSPVMILILEGPNAISSWRSLIGPTDPSSSNNSGNSLRAEFAISKTENSFHGSDSRESAAREILFLSKLICKK